MSDEVSDHFSWVWEVFFKETIRSFVDL
jgi:hypothetical protein